MDDITGSLSDIFAEGVVTWAGQRVDALTGGNTAAPATGAALGAPAEPGGVPMWAMIGGAMAAIGLVVLVVRRG